LGCGFDKKGNGFGFIQMGWIRNRKLGIGSPMGIGSIMKKNKGYRIQSGLMGLIGVGYLGLLMGRIKE